MISFVRPCRRVMKGEEEAELPLKLNLSLPGKTVRLVKLREKDESGS